MSWVCCGGPLVGAIAGLYYQNPPKRKSAARVKAAPPSPAPVEYDSRYLVDFLKREEAKP